VQKMKEGCVAHLFVGCENSPPVVINIRQTIPIIIFTIIKIVSASFKYLKVRVRVRA
jgi:hypothetical protein